MAWYYLDAAVPYEQYDWFLANCCCLGMLGSEEKVLSEGMEIRAYFKDEAIARKADAELKRKNPAIKTETGMSASLLGYRLDH